MGVAELPGSVREDAPNMCIHCHLKLDPSGQATVDELTCQRFEYIGDGKICMTLKTGAGEIIVSIISASVFLQNLNLAAEFLNANLAEILSAIKVF